MVQLMADFVGYTGPVQQFLEMIQQLDTMKVDAVTLSDDLWLHDIFTIHGAVAVTTDHIKLTFVTNPYSRHPALVARATGTLADLAQGRVRVCYAAGGSFTLKPLNIPMWDRPLTHLREAIQVCKDLLQGNTVTFEGRSLTLTNAQLKFPLPYGIPEFFIAGRGPKVMALTGELADGAFIDPISDTYEQMIITSIKDTAIKHHRDPSQILFHSPITYLQKPAEEFAKYAALRIANALMDTPLSLVQAFEERVSPEVMDQLLKIHNAPSSEAAAKYVSPEITKLYPGLVNTPEQLLETIRLKVSQGFTSIGIVVPPGEEPSVMQTLSEDLVKEIHHIS